MEFSSISFFGLLFCVFGFFSLPYVSIGESFTFPALRDKALWIVGSGCRICMANSLTMGVKRKSSMFNIL